MKTTVFITRRGKSFAIAKVISLAARIATRKGEFQSGQMGQTVNLLSLDFGGSNPSSPTRQDKTMPGNRSLRFFQKTTLLIYKEGPEQQS